jgi:hypothetical protein
MQQTGSTTAGNKSPNRQHRQEQGYRQATRQQVAGIKPKDR